MDRTLDVYMKLNQEIAWELTKQLIDKVEQNHGVLTLSWHNTNFFGEKAEFYERILKYCSEKGAWMTSGREIERIFYNSANLFEECQSYTISQKNNLAL